MFFSVVHSLSTSSWCNMLPFTTALFEMLQNRPTCWDLGTIFLIFKYLLTSLLWKLPNALDALVMCKQVLLNDLSVLSCLPNLVCPATLKFSYLVGLIIFYHSNCRFMPRFYQYNESR